jgi:hypothetical protein
MSTDNQITNNDDVIDSRDVIARIEELEGIAECVPLDEEEHDELIALKELAEEGEQWVTDWVDGAALIRGSYFRDYVMDAAWPNNCIDWDRAVRELKYDYSSIEFDGVTYWVR